MKKSLFQKKVQGVARGANHQQDPNNSFDSLNTTMSANTATIEALGSPKLVAQGVAEWSVSLTGPILPKGLHGERVRGHVQGGDYTLDDDHGRIRFLQYCLYKKTCPLL